MGLSILDANDIFTFVTQGCRGDRGFILFDDVQNIVQNYIYFTLAPVAQVAGNQ